MGLPELIGSCSYLFAIHEDQAVRASFRKEQIALTTILYPVLFAEFSYRYREITGGDVRLGNPQGLERFFGIGQHLSDAEPPARKIDRPLCGVQM